MRGRTLGPDEFCAAAGADGACPLAGSLGVAGSALYERGSIRAYAGKPEAFLVQRVGHFPDVSQRCAPAPDGVHGNSSALPSLGSCCEVPGPRAPQALTILVLKHKPGFAMLCFTSLGRDEPRTVYRA